MKTRFEYLRTSPIARSLVWALAILAAAYLFKHRPAAAYWIESALMVGALTFLILKRPVCLR